MNNHYVYQYFDPVRNEPIYIGKGCNRRAWSHLSISKNKKNKAYNYHNKFYNRINWIGKQGKEPIISLLEENLSKKNYGIIETQYIKKIGRSNIHNGPLTNLTDGGEGISGYHHTKESKIKIGKASKGRNKGKKHPWFGKHLPEETRIKIGLSQKGKKISLSTRKKQAISKSKEWLITFPDGHEEIIINLQKFCRIHHLESRNMGRNNKQHKGFLCKPLFKKKKLKSISLEHKNKIRNSNSKEYLVQFPDGRKVKIKNLLGFCRNNNLNQSHMYQTDKGNYKQHKGFKIKGVINTNMNKDKISRGIGI